MIIAGMAWSRTYLQVHWLTDALAGSLLGIALTLACFATAQILLERRGTEDLPLTVDRAESSHPGSAFCVGVAGSPRTRSTATIAITR